jgi:ferredoxin
MELKNLILDLSLFSIGLTLTILGSSIYDGRWILMLIGIIMVIIPIKRANIGNFSKIQGINEINVEVEIDKESCMGVGSCVSIAPQVFKIDESSLKSSFMAYAPLKLLDEHGASNQTILEAAQSCPYKAIILKNKDNNERIYP